MGISLSTARVIAPASWIIDVACQIYGMKSTPNMLDRHNQFYAAFSPWAYAIPIFFGPQQLLQLFWLSRLWGKSSSVESRQAQIDYAPVYALGNICIAVWMILWNQGRLDLSFIPVAINTVSHLVYIAFFLPPMTRETRLTHWVAKTTAGIGLLDFVHNGASAFYPGVPPSAVTKVLTGVFSIAASVVSDSILSGCIAYDLAALAIGQKGQWQTLLAAYAGTTGLVTVLKVGRIVASRKR